MKGLNIVIIGSGMYVCGRGTDGYGTIMPAICQWSKKNLVSRIFIAGNSRAGIVLAKKKISPDKKKKGAKVIYHDPCHLARGLNIISEPRRIVKSLGYEVVEFDRNKKKGLCCGAGGGLALLAHNEARRVAELKIEEAKETGAQILVTFCPQCKRMLNEAADGKIMVRDIVELL